jgi:hypothetical protein
MWNPSVAKSMGYCFYADSVQRRHAGKGSPYSNGVPNCENILQLQCRTPSLLQDSTLPSRVPPFNCGIRV